MSKRARNRRSNIRSLNRFLTYTIKRMGKEAEARDREVRQLRTLVSSLIEINRRVIETNSLLMGTGGQEQERG